MRPVGGQSHPYSEDGNKDDAEEGSRQGATIVALRHEPGSYDRDQGVFPPLTIPLSNRPEWALQLSCW